MVPQWKNNTRLAEPIIQLVQDNVQKTVLERKLENQNKKTIIKASGCCLKMLTTKQIVNKIKVSLH